MLAHSPDDPEDSAWPHRVVWSVIDKLGASEIEKGMLIERFNMRGVHSRTMFEGGNQERILARQYRGWAEISRARWPGMARVLEMRAQHWEEHAQREDVRAEQEKLE